MGEEHVHRVVAQQVRREGRIDLDHTGELDARTAADDRFGRRPRLGTRRVATRSWQVLISIYRFSYHTFPRHAFLDIAFFLSL